MPSFDAVCEVDLQEVKNAVNQAMKEITTRYDFRNSEAEIVIEEGYLMLSAEDTMKLQAVRDILNQKLSKRGLGLKAFDYREPEDAAKGTLRQRVDIQSGIPTEKAREFVKLIKGLNIKKVQAQIQDDQLRVSGPKKDDLQEVIKLLKEKSSIELQFKNFKD